MSENSTVLYRGTEVVGNITFDNGKVTAVIDGQEASEDGVPHSILAVIQLSNQWGTGRVWINPAYNRVGILTADNEILEVKVVLDEVFRILRRQHS